MQDLVVTALLLAVVILPLVLATGVARVVFGPERATDPVQLVTWPAGRPQTYVGCITCEGAEANGAAALIRHQEREHSGGVRW